LQCKHRQRFGLRTAHCEQDEEQLVAGGTDWLDNRNQNRREQDNKSSSRTLSKQDQEPTTRAFLNRDFQANFPACFTVCPVCHPILHRDRQTPVNICTANKRERSDFIFRSFRPTERDSKRFALFHSMEYEFQELNESLNMKTRVLSSFGVRGLGALFLAALLTAWVVPVIAQEREEAQPGMPEKQRQGMKQKLGELQNELRELENEGKEDRAAEVRRQTERIKRALASQEPRPERPRVDQPRRMARIEREEGRGPEAKHAEMEKRHEHLRMAIENLHAAGLPDLAERVAREGKRILVEQQSIEPRPGVFPGPGVVPGRPGPMMEQLRNEVKELREVVRNLDRRIDELAKQAAELRKRREGEPR